ncbi:MAG: F0F1 ATP synthase subunit delta [Rhodospirillaceae bacterium]|mgnify:CR=1 FL=1|nr:F0F1 ATP synthase subunit delta [Rhodospirillaceae bacterium]
MATEDSVVTGLSGRYARALYELAYESKQLDQAADDLRALSAALSESDDLRRLVDSPVLSRDEQGKAMTAIMDAMKTGDLVCNTVGLLAQQRRLFALDDIISDYLRLLAAHRGEATAEVTSARELSGDELDKLRAALKDIVGRDVAVETKVDPDLLGGLVVRIGSRMLDSSIRTKLERLELAMKGVG